MGLTFRLGQLPTSLFTDASNNVGIGAAASGSYKLQVTGTTNLTGALSGTSATFSSSITTNANNFFNNTSGRAFDSTSDGVLMAKNGGAHNIIFGDGNVRYFSLFTPSGAAYGSIRNFSTSTDILSFTSGGNVGIGTTSPSYTLDVLGTGRFSQKLSSTTGNDSTSFENTSATTGWVNLVRATSTGANGLLFIENSTGNNRAVGTLAYATGLCTYTSTALQLGTNNNIRLTIPSAGGLIVIQGLDNFGYELRLRNTANLDWSFINGGDNVLYLGFNGAVRGTFNPNNGIYTASSDVNKKKDFELSTIGLDAILGLKSTLYRMKDDEDNSNKHLGFIAQEVKEFIPQAYTETILGDTPFIGLDYQAITSALVKAVQEQQIQIQNLQEQINILAK